MYIFAYWETCRAYKELKYILIAWVDINYFSQLSIRALLGPEHLCQDHEFQCAAGFCIMGYKKCNGIRDCPSGNDEENCPQPTGMFIFKMLV